MAGLLDDFNYFGDDTKKDQFGQTQADRREPLWSGLIQGGMGLLAGSQDISPTARAQAITQAGQAYAGIPKAMMDQRSAAAQQTLQAQQVKAGQSKLDAQARLAVLAKSPEFQAAVAKLDPARRALLQAALDAGDISHAHQILAGEDKIEAARLKFENAQELARAKAEAANPYGKSIEAVHTYNLQHADPGTFEYWKAWDFFSKDQKAPDGTIIPKTDLKERGFTEPTYRPGGPKPPPKPEATDIDTEIADWSKPPGTVAPAKPALVVPPGAAITDDIADKIAQEMKVDETRVVNGVEFYKDKQGRTEFDTGTERKRIDAPGKTATQLPALKPDAAREKALISNNTTITKVDTALAEMARLPDAILGAWAAAPDAYLQRKDPEGQKIRDLLVDLTGVVIHDRSGSAVSEGEMKRLGFLPQKTDTPQIIRQRLESMKRWVDEENRQHYLTNRREYKMPPAIKERYGTGAKPAEVTLPKQQPVKGDDGVWRMQ